MEQVFEVQEAFVVVVLGALLEEFSLFGLEVADLVEDHFLGVLADFHLVRATLSTRKSIMVNELFSNLLISSSPKTAIVMMEITKPP